MTPLHRHPSIRGRLPRLLAPALLGLLVLVTATACAAGSDAPVSEPGDRAAAPTEESKPAAATALPTPAVDGCTLLTKAELGEAIGVPADSVVVKQLDAGSCWYTRSGGYGRVAVYSHAPSLTGESARKQFDQQQDLAKRESGYRELPGLGEAAYIASEKSSTPEVTFVKGKGFITISCDLRATAREDAVLETVQALAAKAASRI